MRLGILIPAFILSSTSISASQAQLAISRPNHFLATGASFQGTFTLDRIADPLNGHPDTDAFNHLLNVPIEFTLSFETIQSETRVLDSFNGRRILRIRTGPVRIELQGDATGYLEDVVVPTFAGAPLDFGLSASLAGQQIELDHFNYYGPEAPQYFGFEVAGAPITVPLDADGYPELADFTVPARGVILRRYVTPFAMTDYSQGPASYSFSSSDVVGTLRMSWGTLKNRYR